MSMHSATLQVLLQIDQQATDNLWDENWILITKLTLLLSLS